MLTDIEIQALHSITDMIVCRGSTADKDNLKIILHALGRLDQELFVVDLKKKIDEPSKPGMNYQEAWEILKAQLERDCTFGARHKSLRALLLMQEFEKENNII